MFLASYLHTAEAVSHHADRPHSPPLKADAHGRFLIRWPYGQCRRKGCVLDRETAPFEFPLLSGVFVVQVTPKLLSQFLRVVSKTSVIRIVRAVLTCYAHTTFAGC